ncbi:MAG: hypothetical protein Q9180_003194, partial [Flavoplaca navasiana]
MKPGQTQKNKKAPATTIKTRPAESTNGIGDTVETIGALPGLQPREDAEHIVEDNPDAQGMDSLDDTRPKSQRPFNQWPDATSNGIQGRSSDKVPTSFKWGFEISEGERSNWFKLLLDPDSSNIEAGQAKHYTDPHAAPPSYNQELEDIVKDYLSALRRHIQAVLHQMLPQSVALSTPVKYVLTVPAMWSNIAINRTRRCAELAGMGASTSLNIVSGPEAAAIWTLQEVPPGTIKIGDTFVIYDAGGGTVDLISYKVTGLKPILRVTMVAPGIGKKCGLSFLNRRFEEFLKGKLGGHASWQDDMLEEGADLYDIFEPVIQDILDLVWQQIQTTKKANLDVKAVLLIGGFGENGYLYKRLEQAMTPEGIQVLKWTTVVRGALIKGLVDHDPKNTEVNVAGRCTSFHYGTESAKVWVEKVHEEDKRECLANKRKLDPLTITIVKCADVDETRPPLFVGGVFFQRTENKINIIAEGEVTPVAHLE